MLSHLFSIFCFVLFSVNMKGEKERERERVREREREGERESKERREESYSPRAPRCPRVWRQARVEQRRRGLARSFPRRQLSRDDVRGALIGQDVPDAVAGEEEEGVAVGELGLGDIGLGLSFGSFCSDFILVFFPFETILTSKKSPRKKIETHRHHLLVSPQRIVPFILQVSNRPRKAQVAIDARHPAEGGDEPARSADAGGLGRRRRLMVDGERPRPARAVAQHRARVPGVRDVDGPLDDGGDNGGAACDDAFFRRGEIERRRPRRRRRWSLSCCCRCCCQGGFRLAP